jgi:hypothetical protein
VAFDCEEFYIDERIQPKETKEQQWWKKEAKKLQICHILDVNYQLHFNFQNYYHRY